MQFSVMAPSLIGTTCTIIERRISEQKFWVFSCIVPNQQYSLIMVKDEQQITAYLNNFIKQPTYTFKHNKIR